MKKFIESVVQYLVFLVVFYIMLTLVAGRFLPGFFRGNILTDNKISANDFSDRRYKDANKSNPVDLMILGSSHAYRGYDSQLFHKAYNLGSSSQTLALTNFIYNKYVDILQPKKIIIDIYPVILGKKGEEGLINILPIFYDDREFIKNAIGNFDIRVLNSLLYFQIFGDKLKIQSSISKEDSYIDGGFITTRKTNKEIKTYKPSNLEIDENNISALRNIVADAEKRGISVFLFQAPLPKLDIKVMRTIKK